MKRLLQAHKKNNVLANATAGITLAFQIKSNLFFEDARQIRNDNIAYSRTSSGNKLRERHFTASYDKYHKTYLKNQ